MELIILYVGTCIASIVMEISNELRLFKDAGKAGYKVNLYKLSEEQKENYPNLTKLKLLPLFIPILNILQVSKNVIDYNQSKPVLLDQLKIEGILEEMTEEEKEMFKRKETALNALIISTDIDEEEDNISTIKFDDENEKSEIMYILGESFDDVIILHVEGDAAKLPLNKQKEKVSNYLKEETARLIEIYSMDEDYDSIDPDSYLEDNKDNIKKRKKKLEDLKHQLIDENNPSKEKNAQKKKIFKRNSKNFK